MYGLTLLSVDQVIAGAHKIIVAGAKRRIKLKNCFSNHFGGSGDTGRFMFCECHLVSRPNATWAVMLGQSDNKGAGVFYKKPIVALSVASKDKTDIELTEKIKSALQAADAFSPVMVVATRTGRLVQGGKYSVFSGLMKDHLAELYDYNEASSDPAGGYVATFNFASRENSMGKIQITRQVEYHVRADAALADSVLETLSEVRLSKK